MLDRRESAQGGVEISSPVQAGELRNDGSRGLALQRCMDLALGSVALLVTSPVFVVTIIAIYLSGDGPVFFRQTRAGLARRPFEILKFRSMRANTMSQLDPGEILGSNPLVTPVGRWIRRFKIDELPQLLNVLSGEMSLVGPRPRPVEQLAEESEFDRRRSVRRPGMTGWAQINGNVEITWADRILLDVWYVEHWSLWLDITIFVGTVGVVLFGGTTNNKALTQAAIYAGKTAQRN